MKANISSQKTNVLIFEIENRNIKIANYYFFV